MCSFNPKYCQTHPEGVVHAIPSGVGPALSDFVSCQHRMVQYKSHGTTASSPVLESVRSHHLCVEVAAATTDEKIGV